MGVVALCAFAAVCTGACKKSSEAEREQVGKAEVRSAEATNEANKAQGEVTKEKNEYLTAVRREQLELRGKLQDQIDDIDRKLLDLKIDMRKDGAVRVDPTSKDAKKIEELITRRQKLEADVNIIERADERGWDEIKANVEQDLSRGKPGKI
jgi:hypothetical protein